MEILIVIGGVAVYLYEKATI